MRHKNHMMRRYVVLLAAFFSLVTAPAPALALAHHAAPEPAADAAGAREARDAGTFPGFPLPSVDPFPVRFPVVQPPTVESPDDRATSSLRRAESPPADAATGATTGDPRAEGAVVYHGYGFDTCVAPSYATMRAWSSSPFRALGVYIGGRGRACPHQPHLTSGWVRDVTDLGWKLLPLYVGSQSPCVTSARKQLYALFPDGDARARGAAEGRDAVAHARALGMTGHSAVYLDMEAYDDGDADCARVTLEFVQGWSGAVRELGYLPGFYSSAGSGVAHMERSRVAGEADLPSAVWFARWHTAPSVHDEPELASGAWEPHRRVHQYAGDVRETYGGKRLQIDKNLVDAPVAVIG
jgi:hypothetical protein